LPRGVLLAKSIAVIGHSQERTSSERLPADQLSDIRRFEFRCFHCGPLRARSDSTHESFFPLTLRLRERIAHVSDIELHSVCRFAVDFEQNAVRCKLTIMSTAKTTGHQFLFPARLDTRDCTA